MKKILFFFLFILCAVITNAQVVTINFDYPQISRSGDYVELTYKQIANTAVPGNPVLPMMAYSWLQSAQTASTDVVVKEVVFYDETAEGKLMPAITPQPISSDCLPPSPVENDEIYNSDGIYPLSPVTANKTYFLRGHGITTAQICPVVYNPSQNSIRFIKSITLENVSDNYRCKLPVYNDAETVKRIKSIADDVSYIDTYSSATKTRGDEVDMLIVTSEEFKPYLAEYVTLKNQMGFFVSIETVEDIYANYSGNDAQEQIRNCVIDYYTNYGISFLIFVGDADTRNEEDNIVPCRGLTALDDPCIPSDMYYSNLDGNWNDNNNELWGEIGEEDLYAEVAVGRFCVDSPEELNNVINKQTLYQDSPVVNDIEKALMMGESLDAQTWGGNYKDEIVTGTNNHGFTTGGLPDNFSVSYLYERDRSWGLADIKENYNETGVHIINHLGHSNVTINMKINASALTTANFKNNGINHSFVIHYSQGCYNGSFDNRTTSVTSYGTADCFAEEFTTLETGNVACIANSRYGWYMPGNTNSSSQFYDRLFYDGLFNRGYSYIGEANSFSKEYDVSWLLYDEYFRWTAFELNLFGDPSMDVWSAKPSEVAIIGSDIIILGDASVEMETNAPNARIALMKGDELLARTTSDENGHFSMDVSELQLALNDELTLHITGHNLFHFSKKLTVKDHGARLAVACLFDDVQGNHDGIMNHGDIMSLLLTVTNSGNVDFEGGDAALICDRDFVTLNMDSLELPNIAVGSSITIDNIAAAISPEAYSSMTSFSLVADDGNVSFTFYTPVKAPVVSISSVAFIEVDGDGDGVVEVGETAKMSITYTNTGDYPCTDAVVTVDETDIFTSVSNHSENISLLAINGSATVDYEFVVSEECPNESFVVYFHSSFVDDMGKTYDKNIVHFMGQSPLVVVDLDKNHNSMPVFVEDVYSLTGTQVPSYTSMPTLSELQQYKAVFLSLGVFSYNHALTEGETQTLVNYLDAGGNLYLEGSSFWAYDNDYGLFPYFSVQGGNNEQSWINGVSTLVGVSGSFTEDLSYGYDSDNNRIDYQTAISPAIQLFNNDPDVFGCATAYDAGNYKVIGASFEYGGIQPLGTPRETLAEYYLNFFGIEMDRPDEIPFGTDTTVCRYVSFLLDGGEHFVSYEWSTGATDRFLSLDLATVQGDVLEISLTTVSENGYISEKTIIVHIDNCYGVDDVAVPSVEVFPNPINDILTIRVSEAGDTEYSIFDAMGRVIAKRTKFDTSVNVNMAKYNRGMYLIAVTVNGETTISKVIKR